MAADLHQHPEADRLVEAEPDLDRRIGMVNRAVERDPGDVRLQSLLRVMRENRDLVSSIVARASQFEERGMFGEALGQRERLRTIHPPLFRNRGSARAAEEAPSGAATGAARDHCIG